MTFAQCVSKLNSSIKPGDCGHKPDQVDFLKSLLFSFCVVQGSRWRSEREDCGAVINKSQG